MLTVHDLDATLAEITWARDNGMKGVIIPTVPGEGLPPYYDQCYDPMWAACQDLELPVHIHGGSGTPNYGDYGAVSMLIYATETVYFAHRPLWFLIWGGVLERFPRMKLVFTESRADWIPSTLTYLDAIYSQRYFSHIRETVKLKPSEYWERQCYVAASFMGPDESALRHDIGLEKMMWGADYPHTEGTWPRTRKSLARCFKGIPTDRGPCDPDRQPGALVRLRRRRAPSDRRSHRPHRPGADRRRLKPSTSGGSASRTSARARDRH